MNAGITCVVDPYILFFSGFIDEYKVLKKSIGKIILSNIIHDFNVPFN